MIVCVAEKPSVGKEIAKVLGASKSHDGYMEGNGYQVTWTFGHLCCLKAPEDYNKEWKLWRLKDLPLIPDRFGIKLIADKGVRKQFDVIKKLYGSASEIINCGDAGQEGELIQRWVMQKAGVKCPVRRLWISSLTEESIRDGFRHLRPSSDYTNLYYAGLARACSDWMLGMSASRLYTLAYSRRSGGKHQVFSIGRVQTPTLAMIVRRDDEIEHFKPKPYWMLSCTYRDTQFSSAAGKIENEAKARLLLGNVKDQAFTVTSVSKKQETENPPQLYDLTSLQVECNKRFGMSAKISLDIIQTLYEKKVSTYPRVDTKYLTGDIYTKCPGIIKELRQGVFAGLPDTCFPTGTLTRSPRVFNDSKVTDHHAIIPTGVNALRAGLQPREMKVYQLIAARFVSVFLPPGKSAKTVVQGRAGGITFNATGRTVLEEGWHSIYRAAGLPLPGKKDKVIPAFKEGEAGPQTPCLERKMTTPPKRFTEATLLQAMETAGKLVDDDEMREAMKENGIGRPSSRAAIIENIIKRGYVSRSGKTDLVSTSTGRQLIGVIQFELLKSPALTGTWERKIRMIESGKYNLQNFIEEIKGKLTEMISAVKNDPSSDFAKVLERDSDPLIGKPCPLCKKGKIYKGQYGYFCSRYKLGCKWKKKL